MKTKVTYQEKTVTFTDYNENGSIKETRKIDRPVKNLNNFFYFSKENKFSICDLEYCEKSERTFDMSFFDLANNENLLNKLNLSYIQGNYAVRYTYESRAKWFSGYLSSFKRGEKADLQYSKSLTNPIIRLLIIDKILLAEVKQLIK